MSKSRLVSGRVKKISPNSVDANRYNFLDLSNAEPDLGVAPAAGYVLVTGTDGIRQWIDPSEISGFVGSRGDIGFTGSQGDIGFTGSQGDIGFTGSKGELGFTGSQGDIGFVGSQGDIGFTGSQGNTGFVGSKGDIGFTGSQGDIGYTGSQGNTGFIGSKGEIGFTGSQGEIGYTGSQGEAGTPGQDGTEGTVGFTGSQGIPGDFAAVGFTGSQGETGAPGQDGTIGFTGSAGSGGGASVGIVNIFQQGTLIVFTGTARWYAPFNLEFQSITARVVESANDDIVIRVKKNDTLFVELEIPEDQFSVVITDNNNVVLTMTEGDYLTVDILQVGTVVQPGSDLYIQFKYLNT
jgi:hypothetical protein